mgnify:CR=1 FL=1
MKQRILKQVSALVFCSVVVTFIVVTMALYTQFGRFMQETVKEEALSLLKYIVDMDTTEVVAAIKKISEYQMDVNDYFDIISIWYRDVLLFKGSRGMKMELALEQFMTKER